MTTFQTAHPQTNQHLSSVMTDRQLVWQKLPYTTVRRRRGKEREKKLLHASFTLGLRFPSSAVEMLRQLLLGDLEDGWSHDSDDTPTNETANGRSSLAERRRPESLETILSYSTGEWEEEPSDAGQASVQVVRKGNR